MPIADAVPLVGCAVRVEGPRLSARAQARADARTDRRFLVIPGVIRVLTPKRAYVPGLGVRTPDGFVYKIPVIVNAGVPGRTLRLTVVEPGVQIDYGGVAGRSLRLRACPPGHPRFRDGLPVGAWTGWAGGIVVTQPTCVHLRVQEGRRSHRLSVGLGVRC
jgi:hypothetical protein